MTAPHIAHAIWQTLRISVPTIWQGTWGTLTPELVDARLEHWSGSIVRRAQIDLEVEGRQHALPGESFVIMSNHQSLYDVPVIYQTLQRRIRMVAKKELFRVPIWGRAMHRAGFICLDRQSQQRSRETLLASTDILQSGTSIWIAPEGTRSATQGWFSSGATERLPHPAGQHQRHPSRAACQGRARDQRLPRARRDPPGRRPPTLRRSAA